MGYLNIGVVTTKGDLEPLKALVSKEKCRRKKSV